MNFYLVSLIKSALVAFVLLTALAYIQWVERKVLAHIQLRIGPRRVGPHGLLQPLADVIKLLTKEDMIPSHVSKFFYLLAPFLAVMFALISIAVIPFGTEVKIGNFTTPMQLTDLNVGVLFILGLSGIGVYGVALAGWASNNKYALIGGLRSSAQMISYELPMAMAIAGPLLLLNSLSFRELVDGQAGYYLGFIPKWSIFHGPFPQIVSFFIFLIAAFAETNRVPFDLPEAENELVAGFHTEYGSMKFAAFFMADYARRMAAAVARRIRLGIFADADPRRLRIDLPLSRHEPGAPLGPLHAAGVRRGFPGPRGRVPDSGDRAHAAALVLVSFEGRRGAVYLHLDSRNAAALPLRSVDEFRLDRDVPSGDRQPVYHGPDGGP
jgi:NADH-quinone oxidoreductase subunit H